MAEELTGQVDRVTYTNQENGFSVLRLRVAGRRDPVTVVGTFVSVNPGESLRLEGRWGHHPRHGEQFQVERYETLTPATADGIEKYLGSGLIKGIGPVTARRIVARFGEHTLDVIDADIERLLEVEGIGPYRIERIRKAWEDQKEIRQVMVFLRSHGVSAAFATRIFKTYGRDSLDVVRQNPYRLAMDIAGIGFVTADKIARALGFETDSPVRAEAGILYLLFRATEEGHFCLPQGLLLENGRELLNIPSETLEGAVTRLIEDRRVFRETLPPAVAETFGDPFALYLKGYHTAEVQIARRLRQLLDYPLPPRRVDPLQALSRLQGRLPFRLAPSQEEAVKRALTDRVLIITGGPGTGKTTLVRAVLAAYRTMNARVCLAAPTGRAAKRLNEATGHPAATIHRLLEFSPHAGGFQRHEEKPLKADLVVIDEASMLDGLLAHHLVKAVPAHATLVFVGDVDQLPSVGPGNVLQDLIRSGVFPVVRLTEIFRQARRSRIVVNAHRIRDGRMPLFQDDSEGLQDFYFIERENPEEALNVIVRLCTERIPSRFGLDPIDDVQILTPMHRGTVGAQRLNRDLQQALNPSGTALQRGDRLYRRGDKVMQIRNNYDKDVFNGDLGRILKVDLEEQELTVAVDGRPVAYDFSELDELVHAYAVTVHKSQGSEYPAVVLPLHPQHYMMLQRNLLYTAVTRGRKLVVIVGTRKALAMAVRNDRTQKRFTLLAERLAGRSTQR